MASRSRNPTNLNFFRGALIAAAEVATAAFVVVLAVVAAVLA